jgi:hypothetical protein
MMNSIATLLLSHKLAAGIAVAVLATGATVGTFAAQDQLPGQSGGASSHAAASPAARPTHAAGSTEGPQASVTPRAVKGIPTDNPHFVPEADGTCTPGEAAVKTTPAGTQVTVPCQAIENGDHGGGASAAATARAHDGDNAPGPGGEHETTPTPVEGSDRAATAVAGADGGRAATAVASAPTPHAR